ncbi:hypothetical protein HW555_010051 [Spodoptera exigua]|uniref:HTH CENPB-type domain-containing protein n=1 Tax=Spodoptera exigua TaxID=7107 RepID=A0A835GA53_SPOEX|nr:hypothetical protein HW555_010051 [Spodoptera exigua]
MASMPNKYQRKAIATRGCWSEDSLKAAINSIKNGEMSVYRAAVIYGIPRKTLERRYKTNNDKKGPMGPTSMLGDQNEKKLADHIKTMQGTGFPLTIRDVRVIAFQFAEQLNIKHKFNKSEEKAGYDWLQMFLRRHPDIVLRKSEGVSIARCQGMNRNEVSAYFDLLEKNLIDNDLMTKPNCVFNMDESGLQLNNRPGHVLAAKGTKAVSTTTSTEKGETITIIACCNAEGTFLPPACIMKGMNKKSEYEDGMPPGSHIFMSKKSAYITSAIFLEWLKIHFTPRKPPGKVLLLLDGHSTHCNSVEMLEYANENEIILLSMPSHTSHFLQPLDRAIVTSITPPNFRETGENEPLAIPGTSADQWTPSRILKDISPIPQKLMEVRKRSKQVGKLLTSEEHIALRKDKENEKTLKEHRRKVRCISESSSDLSEPVLCDTSDEEDKENEADNCAGCGENYYKTRLVEDWLQCLICDRWVHENCTEFDDMCSKCGQKKKKEAKQAEFQGKGKGKGKSSTGHLSRIPTANLP